MSYRRNRKRRHSQAFIDEGEEEETKVSPVSGDSQEKDEEESELTQKETEIWDAFREEHYEGTLQFELVHVDTVLNYKSSHRATTIVPASAIHTTTRVRRASTRYVLRRFVASHIASTVVRS